MIIGDAALETRLGVARGFPNVTLGRDDIIISSAYAEYFGLKMANGKIEENQLVNLKVDVGKMMEAGGMNVSAFFADEVYSRSQFLI